jgi:hypothetical protein
LYRNNLDYLINLFHTHVISLLLSGPHFYHGSLLDESGNTTGGAAIEKFCWLSVWPWAVLRRKRAIGCEHAWIAVYFEFERKQGL